MEEYKPNSHKYREEQKGAKTEKKVTKPVVAGGVKTKKKTEMRKFVDIFVPDDVSDAKSHVMYEIVVPLIKKAISDTVDLVLYGETGRSRKTSGASKVSYRSFYERENDRKRDYSSGRSRGAYDYDDIIFDNRGDAEMVLDAMGDIIDQFRVVSIGDLYDLADISTNNYTVNKYGWTDISGARVVPTRDGGYVIKLPKAMPLD